VTDSVVRGVAVGLLVVLCACSPRGVTGVGSGPPGLDVADAALKGGSPEIALQIADNVLAQNPGNGSALATKGEALTALGRPEEAAIAFSQVPPKDPASVSAQIGLGRIKLASDPVGAEAAFLGALSQDPRNGVALNDLGIARDLQGRHTDAQTAYRNALGVDPDMRAAQVNLALSLAMSGQSRDAVQLLRPLASKPDASPQVRHDMAAVLAMSGSRTEAEQILSKDLPPEQVQQAMDAFDSVAASRSNAAAGLLATTPAAPPQSVAPTATMPPVAASVPVASAAVPQPASATPQATRAPPPPAAVTPTATQPPAEASPVPSPPANTPGGNVEVQLAGPTPSRDAAEVKWERLQRQMPDAFAGHQPILSEIHGSGQTVWRVRTGGFADAGAAGVFCERVRANGASCTLLQ
jgi:Flp pilus assembly protein TadD